MTRLGRHWPALLVAGLSGWMVWLANTPAVTWEAEVADPAWPANWGWAGLGPDLLAILAVLALAVWADRRIVPHTSPARLGVWLLAGGWMANGVGAAVSGLAGLPPGSAVDPWQGLLPRPVGNPADFAAGVGLLILTGSLVNHLVARWWGKWTAAAVAALAGLAGVVAAGAIDAAIRAAEWSAWVEASSRFHR